MHKHLLIISALLLIPCISVAQEIGSGYSCSGTSIIKKGKVISLSKAKSELQAKINALGNNPKNKTKKDNLKAVKAAVINCSKGIPPIVAAGTYTGSLTGSLTKSNSSLCEDSTTITGSFIVSGSGANLSTTAANPLHTFFKGTTGANEFTLTGATGLLVRHYWTIKATEVTSTSALFTVKYKADKIGSGNRKHEVCAGNFSGVMTRTQ